MINEKCNLLGILLVKHFDIRVRSYLIEGNDLIPRVYIHVPFIFFDVQNWLKFLVLLQQAHENLTRNHPHECFGSDKYGKVVFFLAYVFDLLSLWYRKLERR